MKTWRELSLEEKTQRLMLERGRPWSGNWHAARRELARRSGVARHQKALARQAAREAAPQAIARYEGPGVVSPVPEPAQDQPTGRVS